MGEVRIQLALHFTIDPDRQVIGVTVYPEQVQRTLSVGTDIVEMSKVDFPEAFNGESFSAINSKLNEVINEALRKAQPAAKKPATDSKTACSQAKDEETGCQGDDGTDHAEEQTASDGMSMF